MMIRAVAALFLALFMAQPALAEPIPATVEFKGTITASAPDTLIVNGQPWTGPLPDYPYKAGDQITVSFVATPGSAVQSADGLYRYTIIGPGQTGGSNYARTGAVDVSGPITGGGFVNGMTLVYDANNGSYTIELPQDRYTLSLFDGPGYLYDPATNSVSLASTTSQPGGNCFSSGTGCFNITGDLSGGSVDRAPVWGTDGSRRGIFSVLFSGDWFVNGSKVGGATQVPEPGALGLMLAALVPLALRRRRKAATA
jgi:hypothetical protein